MEGGEGVVCWLGGLDLVLLTRARARMLSRRISIGLPLLAPLYYRKTHTHTPSSPHLFLPRMREQSYSRYNAGRGAVGGMVRDLRNLARQVSWQGVCWTVGGVGREGKGGGAQSAGLEW